jgi:hypothetical protein
VPVVSADDVAAGSWERQSRERASVCAVAHGIGSPGHARIKARARRGADTRRGAQRFPTPTAPRQGANGWCDVPTASRKRATPGSSTCAWTATRAPRQRVQVAPSPADWLGSRIEVAASPSWRTIAAPRWVSAIGTRRPAASKMVKRGKPARRHITAERFLKGERDDARVDGAVAAGHGHRWREGVRGAHRDRAEADELVGHAGVVAEQWAGPSADREPPRGAACGALGGARERAAAVYGETQEHRLIKRLRAGPRARLNDLGMVDERDQPPGLCLSQSPWSGDRPSRPRLSAPRAVKTTRLPPPGMCSHPGRGVSHTASPLSRANSAICWLSPGHSVVFLAARRRREVQ